ncbi:MAG: AAA family ATPase [Paludibacteraceae bacterium]|nr:AAA family ATPase [Paludibacteraceae bacterium]
MKYPIGIQTFEEIITGGYSYVDKTELIYKLIDSGKYYFLSRPRRFGKSLLTTTLEAYFQGRKELFKGLAMERLEKDWVEYPTFHLDFSGASYTAPEIINNKMEAYFSKWEEVYGKNPVEVGFENRFPGLLQRAFEKTGRKSVILIDEYDKPLTDAIGNYDLQEYYRGILQGVYGVLKNADKNIRFAFLTGVTRYGQLGIFSAANNPKDLSMSDEYATICGITENELHAYFDDEVQLFADKYSVSKSDMYAMLKRKYDGYHFTERSEDVYNPFSLLNALSDKKLLNYWFATGTPSYLAKILKKKSFDLSGLSNGIDASAISMASFGNGEENIIAALYQSGYLTIKAYDAFVDSYRLGFPNEEVADGFVKYLLVDYMCKGMDEYDADFIKLKRLISSDDRDGFMTQIQLIMSQVPFESNEPKLIEANFRNMLYLMIRSTGHKVSVEHPVLGGRIDVFFETEKYVYIIECKRDQSAQEALAQIDEKKYAKKISSADKHLVKIGVNFSTEERNLTEWAVG